MDKYKRAAGEERLSATAITINKEGLYGHHSRQAKRVLDYIFVFMTVSEERIDLSQLSSLKQFSSFLKREAIEQIARETGFICRNSSRLSGEAFLKMMVHTIMPRNEWSLTD